MPKFEETPYRCCFQHKIWFLVTENPAPVICVSKEQDKMGGFEDWTTFADRRQLMLY